MQSIQNLNLRNSPVYFDFGVTAHSLIVSKIIHEIENDKNFLKNNLLFINKKTNKEGIFIVPLLKKHYLLE